MTDKPEPTSAPGKGKLRKLMMIGVGAAALAGGGAGAAVFALGGVHGAEAGAAPRLIAKADQKRAGAADGSGEQASRTDRGKPTPAGAGGDRYASNYYEIQNDFTANLRDSQHIVQVGLAISTPYDDTVIEHLKTNEIAVRSAVLMALGDASEDQVFSSDGKKQLQLHLARAINDTLKEKEGFGGVGNVYFTNFVVQ